MGTPFQSGNRVMWRGQATCGQRSTSFITKNKKSHTEIPRGFEFPIPTNFHHHPAGVRHSHLVHQISSCQFFLKRDRVCLMSFSQLIGLAGVIPATHQCPFGPVSQTIRDQIFGSESFPGHPPARLAQRANDTSVVTK